MSPCLVVQAVLATDNLFGICYGNFIEIKRLKALGNYSGPIWSNSFSILLLEKPKPNMSMISGFLKRAKKKGKQQKTPALLVKLNGKAMSKNGSLIS